jgi:hypothetical protein
MARPGQRGGTVTDENPTTTETEARPVGHGRRSGPHHRGHQAPEAPQTNPQPETTESGEQGTAQPAPSSPPRPRSRTT